MSKEGENSPNSMTQKEDKLLGALDLTWTQDAFAMTYEKKRKGVGKGNSIHFRTAVDRIHLINYP